MTGVQTCALPIFGTGTYLTSLSASNINGTVATANVSLYDSVTAYTTNQTFYPQFANVTTGNSVIGTSTTLTYNPSTGVLAAGTFSGAVTGTTGTFSSTLGVTGALTYTTASGGGLQAVAIGNATPGTGNFTTLNTTGTFTAATVNAATLGNIGANIVGTGTYITGISPSNINGTVATANVSMYDNVTSTTTNAVFYPQFADKTSGNTQTWTTTSINVNPSTSTVSALAFTGGSGAFTTLNATGITQITNSTASTSTGTGALQVTGGIGVLGNVWVGGNLYVANLISTTQNTVTIQDPLVYLQALGNLSQYNYDIGFYSDYTAPIYAHTGLARNYTSNTWTFFSRSEEHTSEL